MRTACEAWVREADVGAAASADPGVEPRTTAVMTSAQTILFTEFLPKQAFTTR
jgi:hypothetical protein